VPFLQCGAVRLRPLTEAECYARCYGALRSDQVSVVRIPKSRRLQAQAGIPSKRRRPEGSTA